MIISLVSQKGGSGKSTLAISIAAELHQRGLKTLLVDSDPQGTALCWGELAASQGQGGPDVVAAGDNLRQVLPGLAAGYDAVVIDTPGQQSRRLVGSLAHADMALIPCGPSPADLWALSDTAKTIEAVREIRDDLRAHVVINGERKGTSIAKAARKAVTGAGLPVLGSSLGKRVAFVECIATGQGVTEYARGTTAAREVIALVDEVTEIVSPKESANVA